MGPKSRHRFYPKTQTYRDVYKVVEQLRLKILKSLNPMQRKFWYDENLVFSEITLISSKFLHLDENPSLSLKMSKEEKTEFVRSELNKLPRKLPDYIYLPTNPDTRILEIIPNSAVSLQSAKKVPFIVSFVSKKYEGPDSDPIMSNMNISQFEKEQLFPIEQALRSGVSVSGYLSVDMNAQNISKLLMSKSIMNSDDRGLITMNNIRISNPNFINAHATEDSNKMLILDDDLNINEEQEELRQNLIVPHLDIKMFNKHDQNLIKSEGNGFNEVGNGKQHEMALNFEDSIANLNDLSACTDEYIEEEIKDQIDISNKS